MNKQLPVGALMGMLALATTVALVGCGPEDSQSVNAASGTPTVAAKVGHEECTDEVITHTREPKDKDQIGGTVAGAVIGGVIGSKVGGKGDSKTVATVAGAAAGGYAGNKIQENAQEKNTYTETKRNCRMVYN